MSDALYPNVEVQLTGQDGNGFLIISRVRRALERAGYNDGGAAFMDEALECESYDKLLQFVMSTVVVT